MRVYADSSALIKRSVEEAESAALDTALEHYVSTGAALVSSSLAWVEIGRALRSRFDGVYSDESTIATATEVALSGVAERSIGNDVVSLARRLSPSILRSLDAIHLATAILLDVDLVLTYDDRLVDACHANGLAVAMPGR